MTEREETVLELISGHCGKIQEYLLVAGNIDGFMCNEMIMDAVALRVLAIGELVKRLSQSFREEAKEIEKGMGIEPQTNWKGLAGIRDFVAHEYDNLDFEVIYDTALLEIPQLKSICDYLLNSKKTTENL